MSSKNNLRIRCQFPSIRSRVLFVGLSFENLNAWKILKILKKDYLLPYICLRIIIVLFNFRLSFKKYQPLVNRTEQRSVNELKFLKTNKNSVNERKKLKFLNC